MYRRRHRKTAGVQAHRDNVTARCRPARLAGLYTITPGAVRHADREPTEVVVEDWPLRGSARPDRTTSRGRAPGPTARCSRSTRSWSACCCSTQSCRVRTSLIARPSSRGLGLRGTRGAARARADDRPTRAGTVLRSGPGLIKDARRIAQPGLEPAETAARIGFETPIAVPLRYRVFRVQTLERARPGARELRAVRDSGPEAIRRRFVHPALR